MMYQTIKDNIINPKVLLVRTKDRFLKTFGFFFFFATLLALPAIIDVFADQDRQQGPILRLDLVIPLVYPKP